MTPQAQQDHHRREQAKGYGGIRRTPRMTGRTRVGNHAQPRERTTCKCKNTTNIRAAPTPTCLHREQKVCRCTPTSSRQGGSHTPPPRAQVCYMQRTKVNSREPCPRHPNTPAKEEKGMPTHTRVIRTQPRTPHTQGMKGLPARASHRKHDTTATATDKQHGMKGQEG